MYRSRIKCLAFFLISTSAVLGQTGAPNTSSSIFPKSCTSRSDNSEQIRQLWQAIADRPTAGAYNTLGVLYAAANQLVCAIPAFESALRLDHHNWESHYNLGLGLLSKGDRRRAGAEFRLAIQQKPDSAAAHFALATLLRNENRRVEAVKEFERTLTIDRHQTEAALALARIATESGNTSAAIATLETALQATPSPEQAQPVQVDLAAAYARSGDENKALNILKGLIARQPDSAEAHFSLGEFERSREQSHAEEAASEYQQALRLDPKMDKARLSLGKALIAVKRYQEAVPFLQELVTRRPKDENGFYLLGVAYEGQHDLSQAAHALQHAAWLNPKGAETKYELGGVLAQQGHFAQAITELEVAARLEPGRAEIHDLLASLLDKTGQKELAKTERAKYAALKVRREREASASKLNEEANRFLVSGNSKAAVESYRKALRLNSSDARLHYNLSLALDKLGDQAGEREELLRVVHLDPNLSVAQNQLGLLALRSGTNAEAELRFKKAINTNPEYAEAKSNLGVLYSKENKNDEAGKLFQEAIENDPKYSKAYVNLGLLMAQRGRYSDAERLFRIAVQADPNNADAFNALGMLQAKTGYGTEAIKTFRKAVALNPNSSDAHLNLGIALVDQYDRSEGFQEFSEAARLDPKSAAAHYNLGRFYFETGKYEEAREELEQASKLQMNFARALYFLAMTEKQNNDLERSTELFRQVVALEPDNADAQYLLGQNLEHLGKTAGAIEHWKAAVSADPNHSQALYNLAKALNKSGNPEAQKYQSRFNALEREQQIGDRVQQLGNFALEAANAQNWPQALEQMSQAIELCGNCPQAAHLHRNLGLFYARTGNLEDAEKELHAVLELSPGDSDAQRALAVLANVPTAQAK